MKVTPKVTTTVPRTSTTTTTTAATTPKQATPATTSTTTATPQPLLGQKASTTPAPSVPVEQRAGKTTAIHALKGLPIGQSFAAIDLGSSSGKMLVGKVTAAGVQIVVDRKIGCALGKDVENGEDIPAANMDRAIDALKAFKDIAQQHGVDVDTIPLITTAVVRNAKNGGDFVARVKAEVGLNAKVLSGDEEADVGFRGALGAMLNTPGRYATIDLGGGSFQLAVGTHEGKTAGGSTQVGSNIILDTMINPRSGADGVVSDAVFAHVDATLKSGAPLPLDDDDIVGRTLVATGGVSKFLRIQLGKDVIGRDEVDALRRQLGALPIADRAAFVVSGKDDKQKEALGIGTSPGANDYGKKLPASLSLLLHIIDGLGLKEIQVSSSDARHALLNSAIAQAT